jgi:SAM-dependent methyltransferase
MEFKINPYNDCVPQFLEMFAHREREDIANDPIMPWLLEVIGDVSGLRMLDAGCGEGYVARILSKQGAKVTAIDIAEGLVKVAQAKDLEGLIDYQVANLSEPLPGYTQHFDLIVSNLVLNDVYDYQGFITTLGEVVKPQGRVVLSMNNPYSYVVRKHITDYFDTGKAFPYRGMVSEGVKVHFYQRTLEQYLNAFFKVGFQLAQLIDVPTPERFLNNKVDKLLPPGYQFPYFMILSFIKRSK